MRRPDFTLEPARADAAYPDFDADLHIGDVNELLAQFPADYYDAVLCDPPYGIGFMGKGWDHAVPGPATWAEILRVAKPGAHVLAFAGTKLWHRMGVGIEDGGWEMRDVLMWLYGSGMPKGQNVSKAIDEAAGADREVVGTRVYADGTSARAGAMTGTHGRYGTAKGNPVVTAPATSEAEQWEGYHTGLSPSFEPINLARKPTPLTFAENALTHGTGALNIDGTRIVDDADDEAQLGRWPANLILDETTAAMLDAQVGELRSGSRAAGVYGYAGGPVYSTPNARHQSAIEGSTGGPSRFYYCAKASRSEREAGLDELPTQRVDDGREVVNDTPYQRGATERRNTHPTVKPVDLTRWLATLLLPPRRETPRRILIPFSGSGSEAIGAMLAGWDHATLIDLSPEYVEQARLRMLHWRRYGAATTTAAECESLGQRSLFDTD